MLGTGMLTPFFGWWRVSSGNRDVGLGWRWEIRFDRYHTVLVLNRKMEPYSILLILSVEQSAGPRQGASKSSGNEIN